MDTVLIKLMKPLPELFGFKEGKAHCLLAEEALEGETVTSLLRKLALNHPDFGEIAFASNPQNGGTVHIRVHLNGRFATGDAAVHGDDLVTVLMGG